MFGWNVNKTKVAQGVGAIQQEKNVCTAISGNQCGEGEAGTGLAGQIQGGGDVAIDPSTENVYVLSRKYHRVEEYTSTGEFVLMIGGHVNKKSGNLCTRAEESECQAGTEGSGQSEFAELPSTGGNIMTVGPEGFLYVGDQARIQKFESDGDWVGPELSLAGLSSTGDVRGVAVDSSGDVFVADSAVSGVHEYGPSGTLESCVIDPDSESERLGGLALDSDGLLGLTELAQAGSRGLFYETQGAGCGKLVSELEGVTGRPMGLAFSTNAATENRLYVGGRIAIGN